MLRSKVRDIMHNIKQTSSAFSVKLYLFIKYLVVIVKKRFDISYVNFFELKHLLD